MDWLGHNHRITRTSFRWNVNSLLSGGLLALLVIGYLILVYGAIIITGLLFSNVQPALSLYWWMPGPWWLTGLGLFGAAATIWPVGNWLRNRVNDLVYGQHDNPYALLSQLNQRLEVASAPDALLSTGAATLAATLNLPYVAIELEGAEAPATAYGEPPPRHTEIVRIPLAYRTTPLGTLYVSARRPHERLSGADMRLLLDLARQVGITLHAAQLTEALQTSREQLVLAREEERRRIRNDLHDGLAPTLGSLQLQLGALRKLIRQNPDQAEAMAHDLREDLVTATAEIRQLVYALRPPMLDELGLVGAIKHFRLPDTVISIEVTAPEPMPTLSAAVEVAVYRIASEAMHNVVKHAQAHACMVCIEVVDGQLILSVTDNGISVPEQYHTGVGFRSMQERAAELGGMCSIQPGQHGGTRVVARLPIVS